MGRPGLAGCIGIAMLCFANASHAGLPTTTVSGVYDETTTQRNNVNYNANQNVHNASTGDGLGYATFGDFNPLISAAFAAGVGGVVNFDDLSAGTSNNQMLVSYAGGTKTFDMFFPGALYVISSPPNFYGGASTPISGSNYLTPILGSEQTTLVIDFPTLGVPISEIGLTLLGASDFVGGPQVHYAGVSVIGNLSDNSTTTASFYMVQGNGFGDVFFDVSAPSGTTIASITISAPDSLAGPNNKVPNIDDLAFITSAPVPEPSTFALILCLGGIVFGRRLFSYC